jgi:hypothetical protein
MREALALEPRTLFVCASYHIGKERAYFGAAQALGIKVGVRAACVTSLSQQQQAAPWLSLSPFPSVP